MMKANQVAGSAILACAIGALVMAFAEEQNVVQQTTPKAVQLHTEGEFPSLGGATAWLNSTPLTALGLRGKVVLIDFWTYSCINWRRSLPYVRAWAEKYKDKGLVVIGVHSPEFAAILIGRHTDDALHSSSLPVRLRLSPSPPQLLLFQPKTVDTQGDKTCLLVKLSVLTFHTS